MSEFSIRTKTFRLGLEDYRALWWAQFAGLFASLPLFLFSLYAWVGVPVLSSLDDLRNGRYQTYLCLQLALPAAYLAMGAAAMAFRWRRYSCDPAMSGERIMVLDSGAIRVIGHGFDVRQSWATVRRIRQGRHHIFIHMNSRQIYTLPKRALAPDDASRLTNTLGVAIRSARKAPSALAPLAETPDTRELWRSRPYRLTHAISHARMFTGLRAEREVCFTRDYVRCTAPAFDTRVDWTNVRSVRRIGGVVAFNLGSGRFVVPASAFATPAEATAFFTQAVAFWRAAEARR